MEEKQATISETINKAAYLPKCNTCQFGVPTQGKVWCTKHDSLRGARQVCKCHPDRKEG